MYLLGTFVAQQFTNEADLDDLDFFAFPEIDPASGRTPSRRPPTASWSASQPKNKAGSVKLLEYLGTPEAEQIYLKSDPSVVAASTKADTSSYSRPAEEGVRDDQRRQATSPSSWTATAARTSPRR